MSLEDALSDIIKEADGKATEDKTGKIVKRIQLTSEQSKLIHDAKDSVKQAMELMSKCETLRRKFWADIELQSGFYLNQMRYDEDQDVVIVYESPIQ